MFVVLTRVKLKPNTHADCAALFQETNPGLVRDQADWLGAQMLFDEESEVVTVLATWRSAEAYRTFSASPEFQTTIGKFSEFFAGPPEVAVNRVLVEMGP